MSIDQEGYELFRRAVVDQDDEAWIEISIRYRAMLIGWVRRSNVADITGESYEDLADEALARAWKALTPERFDQFPSLSALLAYLRTCVQATVIDAARSRLSYERVAARMDYADNVQPDDAVLEQLDSAELWRVASSVAITEAERIVLRERFVFDLPPRAIQARHPQVFSEVRKIYETVRNLCDRMRRNQELRRLSEGHLAT